jgi:membrane protease YdiL (CAAX protease family)
MTMQTPIGSGEKTSRWRTAASGLIATAVVFADPGPDNLIAGYFLAWAYLKSGTIVVPVMLHSLGNLCALVMHLGTWFWQHGMACLISVYHWRERHVHPAQALHLILVFLAVIIFPRLSNLEAGQVEHLAAQLRESRIGR